MRFFIIATLFLLSPALNAQTFYAAPVVGMNVSQLDGDNLAGFHKYGWNFGGKVFARFESNLSLSLELLYSQKGSRRNRRIYFQGEDFEVRLNYAEIPVMLHYHDKNGMIFGAGVSYNALLDTKEFTYGPNNPLTEPVAFETWDLNAMVDLIYVIADHIGVNARYSYSLIPIGEYEFSEFPNKRVSNNLLSFRLMYIF